MNFADAKLVGQVANMLRARRRGSRGIAVRVHGVVHVPAAAAASASARSTDAALLAVDAEGAVDVAVDAKDVFWIVPALVGAQRDFDAPPRRAVLVPSLRQGEGAIVVAASAVDHRWRDEGFSFAGEVHLRRRGEALVKHLQQAAGLAVLVGGGVGGASSRLRLRLTNALCRASEDVVERDGGDKDGKKGLRSGGCHGSRSTASCKLQVNK